MRARVILVEDNFPIAESLRYLLESGGFEVVGMAGDVAAALALVAGTPFDFALLDIDLHGELVSPVAEAVVAKRKHVVFLSGYGEIEMVPPHLRELPRLEKPVDSADLFATIDRLLAAGS
jgi:DNA-binding NtrC family response regulator